jgi:hypothetical protein
LNYAAPLRAPPHRGVGAGGVRTQGKTYTVRQPSAAAPPLVSGEFTPSAGSAMVPEIHPSVPDQQDSLPLSGLLCDRQSLLSGHGGDSGISHLAEHPCPLQDLFYILLRRQMPSDRVFLTGICHYGQTDPLLGGSFTELEILFCHLYISSALCSPSNTV